ncbi:hypothetical protein LEN26_000140 [Aphanomyces euteiches]|uniref:Helicase-associated domain-containing protein n=1 Tax=Aphanomyces euteiches TaxID=100861 RepID=A0A6G0XC91_9STRA|nr:hypothetical protein Ae201684_006263 [Aphanomyces euteiches]KAH9068739.1 hypothetical protein Ae201684P_004440 [Aphanomyces euteiches]KAH9127321.1 hypothetical protein AeMF1_002369 [Aphanomyces euteiches]KAH9139876.1 hypothetical protein AeRB84_015852 [Aphanomyces euteiches]KAH9164243.1 hypothetical protein LEN26_000140 [Aphanomyces euteiches]
MPQYIQRQNRRRDNRLCISFLLNQSTTWATEKEATFIDNHDEVSASQRIKSSWFDKFIALETFKEIHGHLLVPRTFKVPSNDPQWPAPTWKMHLGVLVNNLRTRNQPKDRRKQLDRMGFVWDTMEFHWQINLLALRTYKEKFGHLRVPQSFKVPKEEGGWPEETHGIKLGWVATTLRRNRGSMAALRETALDRLGFL